MKIRFHSFLAGFIVALLTFAPATARACSVCFADADSPMGKAANGAIGMMLILVAVVLGCFGLFITHIVRHARRVTLITPASGPSTPTPSQQGLR